MILPSHTPFTDFRSRHIWLGRYVKGENGKYYQVIQDPDFGYAIVELKSEVVEKLSQEVADLLELVSFTEVYANKT
jgi:5'(3')-deoxyribonucleotidase